MQNVSTNLLNRRLLCELVPDADIPSLNSAVQ